MKPSPNSIVSPVQKQRNPLWWVPSLYMAEGIPNVIVVTVALCMFKRLGVNNTETSLFIAWLYLPWVLKPFWSPIVDMVGSKRGWICLMQLIIGAALAGIAFLLPIGASLAWTLALLWLVAFSSATHDIAADGFYMLELNSHDQALYVGIRSTFYRVALILGQGLLIMLAGALEVHLGVPAKAWGITFGVAALLFLMFAGWHVASLPHSRRDASQGYGWFKSIFSYSEGWLLLLSGIICLLLGQPVWVWGGLLSIMVLWNLLVMFHRHFAGHRRSQSAFITFFQKPAIVTAIAFMLLYRFPEALLTPVSKFFLLDPVKAGGLGLSTSEVGFVQGTIGVIGLLLGGVLGGMAVATHGFARWKWSMVCAISLPNIVYVYLAYFQPQDLWNVNVCVFIEQFGYGFGFTAYMMFLLHFARGASETSHYAFCTGFMALSMMVPGWFAGWLQEQTGYLNFFIMVIVLCPVTFLVSALIKVDPLFGKK